MTSRYKCTLCSKECVDNFHEMFDIPCMFIQCLECETDFGVCHDCITLHLATPDASCSTCNWRAVHQLHTCPHKSAPMMILGCGKPWNITTDFDKMLCPNCGDIVCCACASEDKWKCVNCKVLLRSQKCNECELIYLFDCNISTLECDYHYRGGKSTKIAKCEE